MTNLKKKIQEHPLFWIASITISIISGTSVANWFIYDKIISERYELRLQEKQNLIREKENEISFFSQQRDILSKYKNETEGKIDKIVNNAIEPFKLKISILEKNIEEERKEFLSKERQLNRNIVSSNGKIQSIQENLTEIRKENIKLKKERENNIANEKILQSLEKLEEIEYELEASLEDSFLDLSYDIHDSESCKNGPQPDKKIMTPRAEMIFNPCDYIKTDSEMEIEKSKIEWLKSKIEYNRKRILDLQNKINR